MIVEIPDKIVKAELEGDFKNARTLIQDFLQMGNLPILQRQRLEYEYERINRLLEAYPYNEEKAKELFISEIEGATLEEFDKLLESKRLDYIIVEGKKYFQKRFIHNLGFADRNYKERLKKDERTEEARKLLNTRVKELMDGAEPRCYRIVLKMISRPTCHDLQGNRLRCWLPFPKVVKPVRSVRLLKCDHEECNVAPNHRPQRTIYMEDAIKEDTKFAVEVEYTIAEQVHHIDPDEVGNPPAEILDVYLKEKPPHIVFTLYLRELTRMIVGDETNPYLKAAKIYDWITTNVRYTYVLPYAVYSNISQYVVENLKGDCGFYAILFITMCRIAGVPARWQSGLYVNPNGFVSPHDWAQFYIEPYGWLPADLSFGSARKDIPGMREFYFGNLDGYRFVANTDILEDFIPSKRFWRSDPVDNQVGEMETEHVNLLYDRDFKTDLEVLQFEAV